MDSLARQTHRDFELVLIDNIHKYRRDLVAQRAKDYSFPVRHIAPRGDPFPNQAYCVTMNTGVANASGDVCLFLCDFSWIHPDCLEAHARLQAEHNAPITLDYQYLELPPLKPDFPFYAHTTTPTDDATAVQFTQEVNDATERYAADLRKGRLDPYLWSIFAEPMREGLELKVTHSHKVCETAKLDEDWNWCSFKNESFPTDLLLRMNGIDEEYDQSHVYQDSEFSYRLRAHGIRWYCGKPGEGFVSVINPRPIMNIKRMSRVFGYNRALCFDSRRAEFGLPVNPGFSLREWREKVLRG